MIEPDNSVQTAVCTARYVYCVVPGEVSDWQLHGLDDQTVRAVCAAGLTALVHDCPPDPYQGDDEKVKVWVVAHGDVVDAAWKRMGTVLPMTFDTIVRASDHLDADEQVRRWLSSERDRFRAVLAHLNGRVELGVQVLWDPKIVGEAVAQGNDEICELRMGMVGAPKGMAYFYARKAEQVLLRALEAKAEHDYRACFAKITALCPEVRVNKLKKVVDRQMILNLSVLAPRERVAELGAVIAGFKAEGVEVRFTGPWPPYSFTRVAQRETVSVSETAQGPPGPRSPANPRPAQIDSRSPES